MPQAAATKRTTASELVTLGPLGDEARQRELLRRHPDLFDPARAKQRYLVDHYVVATDVVFDARQARRVSYWYSMWSHRHKDQRWKGFLEVPVTADGQAALAWHRQFNDSGDTGGQP